MSDRNSRNGTSKNFRFWRRCILICILPIVYAHSCVFFFFTLMQCVARQHTGRSTWSRFHVFIIAFRLLVRPHVLQLCCCPCIFFFVVLWLLSNCFYREIAELPMLSIQKIFCHACLWSMYAMHFRGYFFFGLSVQVRGWMLSHAVHVCNVKMHTHQNKNCTS